jgi:hypothetical protein
MGVSSLVLGMVPRRTTMATKFEMASFFRRVQQDPMGTIYRRPDGFWAKTPFGLRPLEGETLETARAHLAEVLTIGRKWQAPTTRKLY